MDLWDQLCTFLRARKITVEDVSNKVHPPSISTPTFTALNPREPGFKEAAGLVIR